MWKDKSKMMLLFILRRVWQIFKNTMTELKIDHFWKKGKFLILSRQFQIKSNVMLCLFIIISKFDLFYFYLVLTKINKSLIESLDNGMLFNPLLKCKFLIICIIKRRNTRTVHHSPIRERTKEQRIV